MPVNEGDGGIVATNRLLLSANVNFHVHAGLVVDSRFGDVIPIAWPFLGQNQFVVGKEVFVILARSDKGNVWVHESHSDEKWLVVGLLNELDGSCRSFAI